MKRQELQFLRPPELQATAPPEARGLARDDVRLLVSDPTADSHHGFRQLPEILNPGDLLVVNSSKTLPASLPAWGANGPFVVNLSNNYGNGIWLAEPRWSPAQPGPLSLRRGDRIRIAGIDTHLIAPFPGIERLWFLQPDGDFHSAMARFGDPIRYGYLNGQYPLDWYQTVFAREPGSAEMPSAGRPFSRRVLRALKERQVQLASLVLHTGVSSLEVEAEDLDHHPLYPEAFALPAGTVQAIKRARTRGSRVVAVGTTVVRALAAAWDGKETRATRGFTSLFVNQESELPFLDGLLTGLHDPVTSHLALLTAILPGKRLFTAYAEAVKEGYLWHEFGDSHLLLRQEAR